MSTISNPAELRRRGIELLVRELGYADAMRFLLQFEAGHGDYTRDRDQFLPVLTDEQLLAEADRLATRPVAFGPGGPPPRRLPRCGRWAVRARCGARIACGRGTPPSAVRP